MIAAILAATFTFTATATGVGKGTPLEFVFAGKNSDRDYESMFLLDESVASLCHRLEAAGLPRGRPTNSALCGIWPVGCEVSFSPNLTNFVAVLHEGKNLPTYIYTGGTRDEKGAPTADSEMPASFFSTYTLSQSPLVFNGLFDQGTVYGSYLAANDIKKGTKVKFTVTWDASTLPRHIDVAVSATNALDVFRRLHSASAKGEIEATIAFDPEVNVKEAATAARALSQLDSRQIKLNGFKDGSLFYRALLPDQSWTNRSARLVQPFELTVDGDTDRLVVIDEDWSVEGDDPKLTPREIPFAEAARHPKTDTCFVFAPGDCRLSRVYAAMAKLKGANVRTWYVFTSPDP